MKTLLIILFLGWSVLSVAQTGHPWEQALGEWISLQDEESEQWETLYDDLCERASHPCNLNTATREELEELPFLSDRQVEELMEYLYRYGGMKSLQELRMIRSLDEHTRQLLLHFVCLKPKEEKSSFSQLLRQALKYGKHEVLLSAKIPFYKRQGDESAYLGDPYKHWFRYQFSYKNHLRIGVVGSQDAGEPFFSKGNSWGYDYYSYYLQLKNFGRLESLVIGKYRLSFGMGLVADMGFSMGKQVILQNMGRNTAFLRPHSSRSASSFLQGAAATIRLGKGFSLTSFVSYRPVDATLDNAGRITTIVSSGYHRTTTEMGKKNNSHLLDLGTHLQYDKGCFHLGTTVLYTYSDRQLHPNTSALYRRYAAQGQQFLNASIDYRYITSRLTLRGETAIHQSGALAAIHSANWHLSDTWSLLALHRYYSYRYTSFYSNSMSDGGHVQNEHGGYVGLSWKPNGKTEIKGYLDYAYHPWPVYQATAPSHALDAFLSGQYQWKNINFIGRYRWRLRQRDNAEKTYLYNRYEHRTRLGASWDMGERWQSHIQWDGILVNGLKTSKGMVISSQLIYDHRWLQLNGSLAYFHTDDYDSRVSLYERGTLFQFSFPVLYGHGIRYTLMARAKLGKHLTVSARLGVTDYFDRATIGTGQQKVGHSSMADLDVQLRMVL